MTFLENASVAAFLNVVNKLVLNCFSVARAENVFSTTITRCLFVLQEKFTAWYSFLSKSRYLNDTVRTYTHLVIKLVNPLVY